jgi:hypothetical protein
MKLAKPAKSTEGVASKEFTWLHRASNLGGGPKSKSDKDRDSIKVNS